MFGTILITVCTLMHLYVFRRIARLPYVSRKIPLWVTVLVGLALWTLFFLGRVYGHNGQGRAAALLEMFGLNWLGILFIWFVPLLVVDVLTGFGLLFKRFAPKLRGWALAAGLLLSVFGLIEGHRPPVVETYQVELPGLSPELNGIRIAAVSDLHLGLQRGPGWLAARIKQIEAEKPDMFVLVGDIFEGHDRPSTELLKTLGGLKPPLGAFAVLGNHEFHGDRYAAEALAEAGFEVLRNKWVEISPGLILAGLDDLTSRRRAGSDADYLEPALGGRPSGPTILLSHTPWEVERAAEFGVNLMLSGHTHAGQIWPFGVLISRLYPYWNGKYQIDGMTLLVGRGTGLWGPRVRLWHPGEIQLITLVDREKSP